MRWEYLALRGELDGSILYLPAPRGDVPIPTTNIAALGLDGWELTAVTDAGFMWCFYFKRPWTRWGRDALDSTMGEVPASPNAKEAKSVP